MMVFLKKNSRISRIRSNLKKISYKKLLLIKNISGTFFLKGISIIIGLLSTPAYLNFFSNEGVLGLWFTILSILNWILTFDLGIGNGLRNNLAKSVAEGNKLEIKKQISSAYIILGMISLVTLSIGYITIGVIPWSSLLKIPSDILSSQILIQTIRIVFLGIIVQFFLKIIISILNALQKNILANSTGVITNIVILIFLIFGRTSNIEIDIINLAYVNIISVIFPLLIITMYTFRFYLSDSKPNIHFYNSLAAKQIVSLGGTFFIIQIGLLIVNSTNQVLITSLYGSNDVVEYQIYYKMFSFVTMIFSLFTQPIWSAISNYFFKGEITSIRKSYKFLNIIAFVGSVCCFAIIPFLQIIFDIWLGKNVVEIDNMTAIIFALVTTAELFMYSSTCIANGIGKLKCQFVCIIIASILKFPVTILLSGVMNRWESISVAYLIVLLPTVIFQPIALKIQLRNK